MSLFTRLNGPSPESPISMDIRTYLGQKGIDPDINLSEESATYLDQYIKGKGIDVTKYGVTELIKQILVSLIKDHNLEYVHVPGLAVTGNISLDSDLLDKYVAFITGDGSSRVRALQTLSEIIADRVSDLRLVANLVSFIDFDHRMNADRVIEARRASMMEDEASESPKLASPDVAANPLPAAEPRTTVPSLLNRARRATGNVGNDTQTQQSQTQAQQSQSYKGMLSFLNRGDNTPTPVGNN